MKSDSDKEYESDSGVEMDDGEQMIIVVHLDDDDIVEEL